MEKIVESGGRRFLLRVESSSDGDDYPKYERLRDEIWGVPEDHLAGPRNLVCENFLHRGTSLLIGAFAAEGDGFPLDGEHLAGFSYGFVGTLDKDVAFREISNLRFYSQYTCVRPAYRSCGLGLRIKEFQREVVLELFGLGTILCTYDPLTDVNARRNVHHFGMDVLEYHESLKGEFGGNLNRKDVPSDRFLMSWDLKREHRPPAVPPEVRAGAVGHVIRAGMRTFTAASGTVSREAVQDVDIGRREETLLVRIPRDFYGMLRETDVDDPDVRRIAFDWRMATRQAFQTLFRRGYRVSDFLRAGEGIEANAYLLTRKSP